MLRDLLRAIARFFGFDTAKPTARDRSEKTYTIAAFDDRSAAAAAARQPGVAAIVRGGSGYKWILFSCPCGCDQQIALNLMQSHSPRWRVDVRSPDSFTVHPSVDATNCGAHFWLRDGRVIWSE